MKKVRSGGNGAAELPDNVAGAEGEDEIVEKFKEVYSALYNSSSTAGEVQIIKDRLTELIKEDSMEEVSKISAEAVKEAAELMKVMLYSTDQIFCLSSWQQCLEVGVCMELLPHLFLLVLFYHS